MKLLNTSRASFYSTPIIAVFIFLTGVYSPVHAADDIYCATYSATAVQQNKQNLANGCGYAGPQWNSNYDYHSKWCVKAPMSVADRENDARISKLSQCKGVQYPVGANKWCNQYSLVAISQNETNLKNKCGLTGPRWSSDYLYHYKWCFNAPKNTAQSESEQRRIALGKCPAIHRAPPAP